MLESNLQPPAKIPLDHAKLQYGGVTDACIDWTSTEECVLEARNAKIFYLLDEQHN